MPPGNWGPIKAIIIPMSEFLQEMASQKICQLCRECVIIVLQVVSVFALLFQPLLTKGHTDPFQPRARHTVTAVRSQGKPGTLSSLGLGDYCARCEKGFPAVPAPASLVPILNRAIVFLNRAPREQADARAHT